MALPTSGPLSMSDIANEFEAGTSNLSLYTFGSTLPTPTVTSNIELANDFYGQSAVTLTSFTYNASGQTGPQIACSLEDMEDTAYHDGSGTYPAAGDNVYSDSSGSNGLAVASYKFAGAGANGNYIKINVVGVVYRSRNCR